MEADKKVEVIVVPDNIIKIANNAKLAHFSELRLVFDGIERAIIEYQKDVGEWYIFRIIPKMLFLRARGLLQIYKDRTKKPLIEIDYMVEDGNFDFAAIRKFPRLPEVVQPKAGSTGIIVKSSTLATTQQARSAIEQIIDKTGTGEFPQPVANPKFSIIIPVYNQVGYTLNCLRSILRSERNHEYEVILVDDCSSDISYALPALFKNLRYYRNYKNQGFIDNCNYGASIATGEILIMLNNDTTVRPDWLSVILRSFEEYESVGIVGAKLVYPDGRLQEAGGILWDDGSAWNYGRGQDPRATQYNYARFADYVSGACLAVRREEYLSCGGFDTAYRPAYCEDSDFCLRLRSRGRKVLYQPFLEVTHFEGVSSGTSLKEGIKKYQVVNSERLARKWRNFLKSNGRSGEDVDRNIHRDVVGRALVIDSITPEPDKDAGSIACYEQLRVLRDIGYRTAFIPEDNFAYIEPYSSNLQFSGIEPIHAPQYTTVQGYLEKNGGELDLIHIHRTPLLTKYLHLFRSLAPQAKIILSNEDLHALREARSNGFKGTSPEDFLELSTVRSEIQQMNEADHILCVSDFERNLLEKFLAGEKATTLYWIEQSKRTENNFHGRNGIVFVGGFRHSPNVEAVEYFVSQIFPLILKINPEMIFYIVGSRMPDSIQALKSKNIRPIGYLKDIRPLFNSVRLSIAPILTGAGLKGKIATSLGHGVPVVTTPIGFEGMGLVDREDGVYCSSSKEEFVRNVIELYEDSSRWQLASNSASAACSRLYSYNRAKSLILDVLSHLNLPYTI